MEYAKTVGPDFAKPNNQYTVHKTHTDCFIKPYRNLFYKYNGLW